MPKPDAIAPPAAEIRARLLDTAREFQRITGMPKTMIGSLALGDTAFLSRVEKGADFNLRSYRKIHEFMMRNWPRDAVPAAE